VRFHYSLAGPGDEAELRALLASVSMPGSLTVTFEREPDYFTGCPVMGDPCRTVVAREAGEPEGPSGGALGGAPGRLAGFMCRALSHRYVDGRPRRVAYYGQLRIAPDYEGRWLLPLGRGFMRDLARDESADLGLTAIADDNEAARSAFMRKPRPGLPTLRPLCGIRTLGILLREPRLDSELGVPCRVPGTGLRRPPDGVVIGCGSPESLPGIVTFLNGEGRSRQFFPVVAVDDFRPGGSCPCLASEDFIVAWRDRRVVGACAVWDQEACKQTVLRAYGRSFARLKPLYDLFMKVGGFRPLPDIGGHIRSAYLAMTLVAGSHEAGPAGRRARRVFAAMLDAARDLAARKGCSTLMAGFTDGDPLATVASERPNVEYRSTLCAVEGLDGADSTAVDRAPLPWYVEIARL